MKIVTIIVRSLLGLVFVFFGLNGFLQFLHMPPPEGMAGDFAKALFVSHYFYVISGLQVVGEALCLIGWFVPLGLTLLGPVVVNILLFHLLLEPKGLPLAIVVSALEFYLVIAYRKAFAGLLKP